MPSVYIAYSHADREFASALVDQLISSGFDIYWDQMLTAGQDWGELLPKFLSQADAFVVIISNAGPQSTWVMSEVGRALGLSLERNRPFIIPVCLDNAGVPSPLAHIQAIFGTSADVAGVVGKVVTAVNASLASLSVRTEEHQKKVARVEQSANDYIRKSLADLRRMETRYFRLACACYGLSAFLLSVCAIGFAMMLVPSHAKIEWQDFALSAGKTVLFVAFVSALIRGLYMLGRNFMMESIRYSDRVHAISFGEFYLNGFGGTDWLEVKEAFQNWNLDRGSSFTSQNVSDVDPQILAIVLEIGKSLGSKAAENKKD
jgi:TIR domain